MTTTPYPPLPPEGVTLSDLMGRLKKLGLEFAHSGEVASVEVALDLERALEERDALVKDLADAAGAFTVPLPEPGSDMAKVMSANRLLKRERDKATAHADAMAKQKDEALADNAEAAELLSHYVDKPSSLVEMVRTLVAQEPDLVTAFEHLLGFFPESVEISGPCSHKLNIDPHKLGGFEALSFERKAETWTTYEDGGRVPDEFRATVRLRGVRRSRVEVTGSDERLLGDLGLKEAPKPGRWRRTYNEIKGALGFTPPTTPAEVKPATFIDRMPKFVAPAATGKSYALRERVDEIVRSEAERTGIPVDLLLGRAKPPAVVVKQLSGEPLRYATDGSAGLDLPFAEKAVSLGAWGEALFPTGVKLEIPPGYEGQIRPRSSCPRGVEVVLGTIDSDYRGEIKVKVRKAGGGRAYFDKPIAQLVIAPVARAEIVQVDSLSETARGEGGFGSTDGHYSEAEPVLKAHSIEEVETKVREAIRDEAQKAGARVESCEVKVITREREKTPSELQAAADEAALIRRGEAVEVAARAINERIKALKVGDEWTDADALKVGDEAMQAAGYSDLLCYFEATPAGRRLKVRDAFEELTPVIGEG